MLDTYHTSTPTRSRSRNFRSELPCQHHKINHNGNTDLHQYLFFSESQLSHNSRGRHHSRVYRIAYGCERTELVLSCEENSDVPTRFRRRHHLRHISIGHATYGRRTLDVCYRDTVYDKNWSFPCTAPRKHTTSILSRR